MGQQQLLLLVLGVIIVGIAVAVGINMFSSASVDAGRDAITSNVAHLASKAQQHFKKPNTMGGGNNNFIGFALSVMDQEINGDSYRCGSAAQTTLGTTAPAATAANTTVTAALDTLYIVGYGKDLGRDNTNLVQVYSRVISTGFLTTVVN